MAIVDYMYYNDNYKLQWLLWIICLTMAIMDYIYYNGYCGLYALQWQL